MKTLKEMIDAGLADGYQAAIWWGAHTARSLYASALRSRQPFTALTRQLVAWRETPQPGAMAISYAMLLANNQARYPLLPAAELFTTLSRRAFLQGIDIAIGELDRGRLCGLNDWLLDTAVSLKLHYPKPDRAKRAAEIRTGRACRIMKHRYHRDRRLDIDCWEISVFNCYNLMDKCQSQGCEAVPT
ncbi:MAG: hypothetical protein B7Z37_28945, partial [Verrucomicrobia bacterium 12-59-8]